MMVIGVLFLVVFAIIALVVGGVTLWSGWRAVRDELRPGFKTRPPGAAGLALTLLGVIGPVLVVTTFTAALAVVLLLTSVRAIGG